MIALIRSLRARVIRVLAVPSMYRLVLLALVVLFVYTIAMSLAGLLAYSTLELVASALAIMLGAVLVDLVGHRVIGRALRWESTLVTALILVFVLRPTLAAPEIALLAVAGAIASASKYVLVVRRRHALNPAAFAAAVMTITTLSPAAWWVGTPVLAPMVALLGLLIAWRTEKIRVVVVFVAVAWILSVVTTLAAYAQADLEVNVGDIVWQMLVSSPILFLGLFMLTEPLTLPPRRWQQYVIAVVVAFFVGVPITIADVSLGSDRALLIGNLVALIFALGARRVTKLTLAGVREVTPRVREITLSAPAGATFLPGQYVELDVAHNHADQRGTRREFSIVSAPADLPEVRLAYRTSPTEHGSTFKRALSQREPGDEFAMTGIWGDFVLPTHGPILLLAAGIGVTPFVSHVRQLRADGVDRDVLLVYVASSPGELAYREEFGAVPVILFTPGDPSTRDNETWAGGQRLSATSLAALVPDLAQRHVLISGPPRLIADLQPALATARGVTTDAFAGY